jgi:transposase-like protein
MTEECGAPTTNGGTCSFNAKYEDGKCGHHTDVDGVGDNEGRPTKLSYERQEKIATAIENGKSISIAARQNDVSPKTVTNWAEKGESDLENGKENEYTEFFRRFRRALGHKENWYLELVLEMAQENGDHRFIMSMLKNEFPNEWGDTETGVEADTVKLEVSERVRSTWPQE